MPLGARRVVVTGVGAVSPAGVGINAMWRELLSAAPAERLRTVPTSRSNPS